MNAETIARLKRLEVELDLEDKDEEAMQVFRLIRVATDAERIRTTRESLGRHYAEAQAHGATLRQLSEISGYSVETVRRWIEKTSK